MFRKPTRQLTVAIAASIFLLSLLVAAYLYSPPRAAAFQSWGIPGPEALQLNLPDDNSATVYLNDPRLTRTGTLTGTIIYLPLILNACGQMIVDFAVIGDYGDSGGDARDVGALVRSWDPDFIITLGDNNYPSGEAKTIDKNIGQHYHQFIGNYTGRFGPGAAQNNFFPALGNHDWDTVSGRPPLPQPYLNYFTLPNNERYYKFRRGPVELFAIDSNPEEPHGRAANSYQANWLRNQLAASKAPWKLVYMHHPPYSSPSQWHGSEPVMRWPYKSWGASAVLAGHNHTYERLLISGFPYFVNGLGGKGKYLFKGDRLLGSAVRYSGNYGAMWVKANDHCITFQFITRTGLVKDHYTLYR
jgi:hypothetical protein